MTTQALETARTKLVSSILKALDQDHFCEIEEDQISYMFSDVFNAEDIYEVILYPYECGADPEVLVTYGNKVIYEGSFQGNAKGQALTKVAEHIADEILKLGTSLQTCETFIESSIALRVA